MTPVDSIMSSEETQDASYFDAHSDMLEFATEERALGHRNPLHEHFLPGMEESNIDYRVAAISIPKHLLPEKALRRALKTVATLHNEVETSDQLELATTSEDIKNAPSTDAHTLILGMEGGEPLRGDVDHLDIFHKLGLRLLTLTHARRNELADGAFYTPRRTGTEGGLTDSGIRIIERASELGVMIDVSHLNDTGFWDVIDVVDTPIIASHSNCRAVTNVSRNLTDDQIEAVTSTGGVVGLAVVGNFIGEDPTLDAFLDHIDHAVDVAGVDSVGFGFDFADYLAKFRPGWDPDNIPFGGTGVPGLQNDNEVKNLSQALRDRGYSDREVKLLTHQNMLRVFETVLE